MYKRKRAGNTITRKINSTKDTAAKADKNHYISNSYLEGFIPIDTEYFTASCHSSVRLQISLQLRHFFRQEIGKVNRPVRIQMVRIAKVFQIGLKSLVMGVIIIAHAIFQRNLVDHRIEFIQEICGYILIVVNSIRCCDQNRRDVPFLTQSDQIDQILFLIFLEILLLVFKVPLISCKSSCFKFRNRFSAVDFIRRAGLCRTGFVRV